MWVFSLWNRVRVEFSFMFEKHEVCNDVHTHVHGAGLIWSTCLWTSLQTSCFSNMNEKFIRTRFYKTKNPHSRLPCRKLLNSQVPVLIPCKVKHR